VEQLLQDLDTLTEYSVKDWIMHYRDHETPFTRETFDRLVPLSPRAYRERVEDKLNEVRSAAGLPVRAVYDTQDKSLQTLQSAAGII